MSSVSRGIPKPPCTPGELRDWLVAVLAERLQIGAQSIDPQERFGRYGLDSVAAVSLMNDLSAALERPLSPTLVWEHPTVESLARFLEGAGEEDAPPPARTAVMEEPIAMVGLACRFPRAADAASFWALLRSGVDAISEAPQDRWRTDALYDADPAAPGKMSTRWGGFLDRVDAFDAAFFGISPREAVQMDPQQRLMLELAWEALEDAGTAPGTLQGSRTGVFVGAMWSDYARLPGDRLTAIEQHTATGQDTSILSGRISYALGLQGPSLTVNTACSSSLVAVHLACQSLRAGESALALAGGVNLILAPDSTVAMTKFGAMSPDGRSKAFDARANGYVRGEGGGVVVLKRLRDALADGDRVYCVVRGSAVNNDGFSSGLTAPNPRAQEAVVRDACLAAGIVPAQVQYVEAHGTGTQLGDPIEAKALGAVLGAGRPADRPLRIGSVKTNVGHLEAAAGMAGIIKLALAMQHRELPPSLHFEQPNPHIPFDALRLQVQTALTPWPEDGDPGRLLAGVSSFGFGGTNCHVVLEGSAEAPRLLLRAAESEAVLRAEAQQVEATLRTGEGPSLAALCDGAQIPYGAFRIAAAVRSRAELERGLRAFAAGHTVPGLAFGRAAAGGPPRVAFVFGGHGSQWHGMGRALLLGEPVARAVLQQCDQALRPHVPWSLTERLLHGDAELFEQTDFAQPAIFALQLAIAATWRARGVEPAAVCGQSIGEVAAACVAGALSLEDAARVICQSSRLVARATGRTAVLGLSREETDAALAPFGGRLCVAGVTAPAQTVVAGDEAALQELLAALDAQGRFGRLVRVRYATHSPYVEPLLPELRASLTGLAPRPGEIPFHSTLTAAPVRGPALDAAYWARNVRDPVLLAPTVDRLARDGIEIFVEIDPHPVLVPALEQCLKHAERPGLVVGSARRDESECTTLLEAAGRLFVAGVPVRPGPERAAQPESAAHILTLSARSAEALTAQALQLRDHLVRHPEQRLDDVAFSLATTRSALSHRLSVVAGSRESLCTRLAAAAQGKTPAGVTRGRATRARGKLAFLFPGQGAQALGMGRGLHAAWPAFRVAFDRCTALFDASLDRPLRAVMWAEPGTADAASLDQTAYTQPALFTLGYALSELWLSWGIRPELVAGHSVGELLAACVAGVFSLEDAVKLVAARGALMQALPEGGAMVSIAAPEGEVAAEVAKRGGGVSIAAVNGPAQTVISGDAARVEEVAALFKARGVKTRKLEVSHAFHSARMEPMLDAFARVAADVRYEAPQVPIASNVTGTLYGDDIKTPVYWVRQVREAVRFGGCLKALGDAGARTFVELGPRSVLLGQVPACVPDETLLLLAPLRAGTDERASVLDAAGGLWAEGGAVRVSGLSPTGGQRVPLPTYPWQRERYWLETKTDGPDAAGPPFADWLYQLSWRDRPRPEADAEREPPGAWLVLADGNGLGAAVAALISARGHACTLLQAPADAEVAERLTQAVASRDAWQGVLYLWGLDAVVESDASAEEVGRTTQRATFPVLALLQSLGKTAPPPRLWIVTRGACTVGGESGVAVCQSALWGLGRVVSLEHPAAWGGLVDLDPQPGLADAETLAAELRSPDSPDSPDSEDQLAFRAGRRHAARLVAAPSQAPGAPVSLSADATYLVTGGLGALGLRAAQWLVAHGARHLLLTGRSGLPAPADDRHAVRAALAAWEAQGIRVTTAAVDVADTQRMTALLTATEPPLRGVVHAAGIGPLRPLSDTDAPLLESVLRPKVAGAWLLHRLLRDRPLDLFVLFSSGAAVWGGQGQGAYAAANAFLDGLAQERRARSLPALSVAWGIWTEGTIADAETRARLAGIGVLGMPTAPALAALTHLAGSGIAQRTVARMDWARFVPVYAARGRRNLLSELATPQARPASPPPAMPAPDARRLRRPATEARARLSALVRETAAEVLGFPSPDALDPERGFAEQGLDSLMAVQLRTRLETALDVPLSATLALDYPTVARLVSHLLTTVLHAEAPSPPPAARPLAADEPIAIVGAACRLPGDVADLASYWQLLHAGRVVTSEVPASRFRAADFYDPDPETPGRTYVTRGGFLRDVETFDPAFFRISPREAATLDPQQRLLLEVSWEALEHAGQDPTRLRESATGVFIGAGPNEYAEQLKGLPEDAAGRHGGTGNMLSVTAGRLSFFLGLHGPALAVDTACSSSLVALHLGCQSLRAGECGRALVGGVNLLLSPAGFVMLSGMRALAPDGRCKTFSAEADGYARAEGCAVVVLKRLSDAQRDGDRILALIRGSAVNHDGPSSGLTVPSGPAQQAVLRTALAQAGLAPAEIDFVECHGTGTALGDPIEVQALGAVYGQARPADRPLWLGAAKANLGHLEPAAGLAGLLKVVLSLAHEQIPAQPELRALNPLLPWDRLPVAVVREAQPWARGMRPRRAGVSAFGMSGTNAHVVLEEAPAATPGAAPPARSAELVILSAKSPAALNAQAQRLREHLVRHPDLDTADVAFSLATTRSELPERLAVAATSRAGLLDALAAAEQGLPAAGTVRGSASPRGVPKVVFVFPGQGSQWLGMGRQLLAEEPVFRATLEACDRAIQAEAGFSLLTELAAGEATSQLERIDVVQPVLFAFSVALAALWRSWGVAPDAVVGHSLGEVAAAHVAGALTLEDAVAVICRRSRLLRQISGQGEMAMVELSLADAEAAVAGSPQLSVAVSNSPRSTVIAGEPAALAQLLAVLSGRGVFCRRVKVTVASHSPQVEPLRQALVAALDAVAPGPVAVPMLSTVTGALLSGPELAADYWADNLRQPVRFASAVQSLIASDHALFLELSPHPILVPSVAEVAQAQARPVTAVGSLKRGHDERPALLETLGALWVAGRPVAWEPLFTTDGAAPRRVPLPTYPFQRERCWINAAPHAAATAHTGAGTAGRWPLAGVRVSMPGTALHHVLSVGTRHQDFLSDHVVFGKVVVPGAFHITVVLSIAAELWPERGIELTAVEFLHAIALDPGQDVELHAVLTPEAEDERHHFELATWARSARRWTVHARGRVQPADGGTAAGLRIEDLEQRDIPPVDDAALHDALSAVEIDWGPRWRWLREARVDAVVSVGSLVAAFPHAHESAPLPPVLLDNGFGLSLLGGLLTPGDGVPRLPFAVERLRWWRVPGGKVRCGAVRRGPASDITDFVLVGEDGGLVAEVTGFSVRRAPRDAFLARDASTSGGALYQLAWREAPLQGAGAPLAGRWVVVGTPESALASALAQRMAQGVVTAPQGLSEALERAEGLSGVVCVWEDGAQEAPPETAQRVSIQGLQAVQTLLGRAPVRLWWVTPGTVGTAPLWGLGRTVMQEHPELGCTLVEVEADTPVEALLSELAASDDENQIALRKGQRWVARLKRVEAGTETPKRPLTPESTVVVSGGLGALGLHVARWLAGQGIKHLLLLGRRGVETPGAAEAVSELEKLGARVTVAAVDVADREELSGVLEQISSEVPLRGVVHAAVVLEDGVLAEQDEGRFVRVLSPKVQGAWNLHELTQGKELELFTLFSSTSGLLGAAGQGNYAAANTFLDALAEARKEAGQAGQSLAWGAWSEVGLAASMDAGKKGRLERQGIGWLKPEEGIELLERARGRAEANLCAAALEVEALGRRFGGAVPPVWRALVRPKAGRVAATAQKAWAAKLATLPAARRAEAVREAVQADVARVLGLGAASAVPVQRPLSELGLDSLLAIELRNALGQRVGKTLSATLAFDHPTVDALARWLLANVLTAAEPVPVVPKTTSAATDEPIAILGAGCRYPGGVTGPEAFWDLLDAGTDAIRDVPRSRWDADALYDPDPDARGKITTRAGGFLDDVDRFDAGFFDISPREAATLDPQQRLLLETSWEALERAGLTAAQVMGSRTGVYVGLMSHEYATLAGHRPEGFDGYVSTGTGGSVASGRISYVLGLKGPSLTVDTACSSSLVTVHLACQALRRGECALALAGGVTLMLTPALFLDFSRLRGMAPDGRCKSFSAAADGAGWAEGCGMIVLKRLSDAQRDGDPILAVIRGSAVNQDGRSNGLTAPNGPAQEEVIRGALAQAGVAPAEVGYVECHGTGTWLGDPIEVQALGAVLAEGRPQDRPVLIGSVKSNIGHAQAAAGVAGLLKVVLALQHERIPQSLHAAVPNPHVPWAELPVAVAAAPVAWPKGSVPRRAGVSSFGISGTNAHVVLEEAPVAAPRRPLPVRSAELLVLSAKNAAALSAQAAQLTTHLSAHPEQDLGELALSLATTRSPMAHRVAVVERTREGLRTALASIAQGQTPPGVFRGAALSRDAQKVVFVFPGQGSQWLGMAQKLLAQEPVFRQALQACDAAIQDEAGFSLLSELAADEARSRLGRIEVVQPVLFAISVGLAALWRAWGVAPDAVVGHSMGEVAAAHVAGALSLPDAVAIICRRSRLMQALCGRGEMALVELPLLAAEAALSGYEAALGVAASNSPRATVISGDPGALGAVLARLEARGVFCRRVKVDVASHSPQVEPLRADLVGALSTLRPRAAQVPMWSTVRGGFVHGPELDAAYWADNLRRPVRFAEAVQALAETGHALFIELSPHPILVPSVEETLRDAKREGVAASSLRRGQDDFRALLEALGAVWAGGHPVDLARLFPDGGDRVPLPTYPFQRERHWVEESEPAVPGLVAPGGHPLLGEPVAVATQPVQWVAQTRLDTRRVPWLLDHRVQGAVVFPGAGYLEMALATAAERFGDAPVELRKVVFAQALALAADASVTLQLLAREASPEQLGFQIASRADGAAALPWTTHARGVVQRAGGSQETEKSDIPALRARLGAAVSAPRIYAALSARGLSYGPAFQGLSALWLGRDEALGRVSLPAAAGASSAYRIHPALLDACLQVMACTLDAGDDGDDAPWVPVEVDAVRLFGTPSGELFCHVRRVGGEGEAAARRSADLRVVDAQGAPVAEIRGLAVQRLATGNRRETDSQEFLEIDWETARAPARAISAGRFLLLGAGDGLGSALAAALGGAGHATVYIEAPDVSAGALRARISGAFGGEPPTAVVHLGSLDAGDGLDAASVERALSCGCDSVLATVQALAALGFRDAPRLWLVTRGAQAVAGHGVAAVQAPLLGLGRVVAMEHQELRCTRVDLDPGRPAGELDALVTELVSDDAEDEIALRGAARRVARLAPWRPDAGPRERRVSAAGEPFRLQLDAPGVLDPLALRAMTRRAPGPGEVEIEVAAAGLNFLDVLLALGVMPSDGGDAPGAPLRLGGECAGRIAAVGEGVGGLSVGDAVLALAPGAFASHVVAPAALVLPLPPGLDAVQAAAVPVAYLTAYYALDRVARLERGERVLIHAATGGVGLAALQWARHVGAEIYATAGSPEKRACLQALGVRYVSDSRSDQFVADVQRWTGGEGVDVVLNSLSGDFIHKSFGLLRSHGRFVELGKRDYYADNQIGLRPFLRNLSFSLVDLRAMMRERPQRVRALLVRLLELFSEGVFTPPPITAHPIERAAEVLRTMAQAQHTGKLVLTLASPDVEILVPAGVTVRSGGSYLVTGGLGGLGLSVAGWLAERGAGQIVLVGRSGAVSEAQRAAVAALAARGARVVLARADVADRAQLAQVLSDVAASGMPLRGVVHAAAVLDDELLVGQTPARFRAVMAPKILGALNLDALTRATPLDFFVMYSSGAGLLGSPGQGNYAAANTFLDALAHDRRARGLPALSIDWGAFSQVGLAAAQENRGARLASRGIKSLTPDEGLVALGRLLGEARAQVGVLPLDVRQWVEFYPAAASSRLLSRLLAAQRAGAVRQKGDRALLERLADASPAARVALLQEVLLAQASQVLRIPPGRLDAELPLSSAGMDSLMGLELRNRIEATLGITIPATLLWTYPTVAALSSHLAAQTGAHAAAAPAPSATADASVAGDTGDTGASDAAALDEMSEDELALLIAAKFEELS